jgi:hypothetical protein
MAFEFLQTRIMELGANPCLEVSEKHVFATSFRLYRVASSNLFNAQWYIPRGGGGPHHRRTPRCSLLRHYQRDRLPAQPRGVTCCFDRSRHLASHPFSPAPRERPRGRSPRRPGSRTPLYSPQPHPRPKAADQLACRHRPGRRSRWRPPDFRSRRAHAGADPPALRLRRISRAGGQRLLPHARRRRARPRFRRRPDPLRPHLRKAGFREAHLRWNRPRKPSRRLRGCWNCSPSGPRRRRRRRCSRMPRHRSCGSGRNPPIQRQMDQMIPKLGFAGIFCDRAHTSLRVSKDRMKLQQSRLLRDFESSWIAQAPGCRERFAHVRRNNLVKSALLAIHRRT